VKLVRELLQAEESRTVREEGVRERQHDGDGEHEQSPHTHRLEDISDKDQGACEMIVR
jgi:hypothetical protein